MKKLATSILITCAASWRYLIATGIGFGVDFGVSMVAARLLGSSLLLAAVAGFGAGLISNYLMFEFWAFRRHASNFSSERFSKTVLSGLIALVVRLSVIAGLGMQLARGPFLDAGVFVAAAGISAVINFAILTKVFDSTE